MNCPIRHTHLSGLIDNNFCQFRYVVMLKCLQPREPFMPPKATSLKTKHKIHFECILFFRFPDVKRKYVIAMVHGKKMSNRAQSADNQLNWYKTGIAVDTQLDEAATLLSVAKIERCEFVPFHIFLQTVIDIQNCWNVLRNLNSKIRFLKKIFKINDRYSFESEIFRRKLRKVKRNIRIKILH